MYYLLTESFKEQEKELVRIVLEAVPAYQVYLLGSTLAQRRTETVFMSDAPSRRTVSHYYILVLVNEDCHCAVLQDKLENTCRQFIPVTALVLQQHTFLEWLLSGHVFATTVHQRAVLLHGEAINCKPTPITNDENVEKQQRENLQKVKAFYAGAELFMVRKEYKMAAFMLHQCTEHALLALLKKKCGLHVNTHNLDKLLRYCSMVNYRMPEILPRNNEQQEKMFQLLQKAYIDTRYKDDYRITMAELETMKAILVKFIDDLTNYL